MADISTTFCGRKVKSPLGIAAIANYGGIAMANPRARVDAFLRAVESGAGWVTLAYTCTEDQKDYPKGKEPVNVWGMVNEGGIPRFPDQQYITATADETAIMARRDEALEQIALLKRELPKDVPIKADCIAPGADFDKWVSQAKEFEKAGVDFIELDVSCPETAFHEKTDWAVEIEPGMPIEYLCNIPKAMSEMIGKMRKEIKIPIGFKMSAETGYPRCVNVANEARKCGVDFIDILNAPIGFNPIDIYNDGKPLRSMWPYKWNCFTYTSGMGRTRARAHLAAIKRFVPDVELIAISGLHKPEHIVDYIMMGAQVCESCSGFLYQGVQFFKKCNAWLGRYLEQMGYDSINEIRGAALKYLKMGEEFDFEYGKRYTVTDTEKCNACMNCVSLCAAPYVKGNKVLVDPDKCAGCALCTFICPEGARTLVTREMPVELDVAAAYAGEPWRRK